MFVFGISKLLHLD